MPLPNQPIAVQCNWTDASWPSGGPSPWEQTNANYLSTCLQSVEIDRWSFRGSLRASSCRIVCTDPSIALRPGKVSSPLYPNVRLGRRVRVLIQSSPGVWTPGFFGYIKSPEPDAMEPNPLRATITLDSPLAVLAPMPITLPPSDRPYVYKADDPYHSALWLLLKEANLWDTAYVDLDPVGETIIDGVWGDGTKSFAEWLGELCRFAGAIVSDEPQYATASGQPDFTLHWYRPLPAATAAFSWVAADGDLEPQPRIEWNGDTI